MTEQHDQSEIQAAYGIGLAHTEQRMTPAGVAYEVLADADRGARVQMLDDEALLTAPKRKRGTFTFRDVASYIEYLDRHASTGTLQLADASGGVRALLNHHTPEGAADWSGEAGWGDHVAVLARPFRREWEAWTKHNGQALTQTQFAEFLEDRIGEIASPDGAALFEVIKFFEAKKNIGFSSGIRLDNGQVQLRYEEEVSGQGSQNGTTEIPTEFVLVLRPYDDSQPIQVPARLRWRLDGTDVRFTFKIGEELRERFDELVGATLTEIKDATENEPLRGADTTPAVVPLGSQDSFAR